MGKLTDSAWPWVKILNSKTDGLSGWLEVIQSKIRFWVLRFLNLDGRSIPVSVRVSDKDKLWTVLWNNTTKSPNNFFVLNLAWLLQQSLLQSSTTTRVRVWKCVRGFRVYPCPNPFPSPRSLLCLCPNPCPRPKSRKIGVCIVLTVNYG